ncbi:MAG: transcription antitermination factor NusB [Muribaculaceae bacterium]|nr:transcription antitermination factor NusB [Muribaculaceae bacterium]
MINRVLIRTKVVQLLYSYLLVEKQFAMESLPDNPTREKRFAYGLYLDMLCLMADIADGITRRGGDSPLGNTRFIKLVKEDETVKSLLRKYRMVDSPMQMVEDHLTRVVKESGLYKKFLKSEDPGSLADEKIWQEIFKTIIIPDQQLSKLLTQREDYTLGGVDRMQDMMEQTFTNFYSSADGKDDAFKTLRMSMDKARELYFRLLWLPVQLVQLRDRDIDEARRRYVASAEDRNPNMRFVENEFVKAVAANEDIDAAMEGLGRNMTIDDEPMLRSLLRSIMESELYKEYMEFPATDFEADCEFWRQIYKNIIFVNEHFLEALEDKSVFWNDDLDTIGTFVIKTVKRMAEHKSISGIMATYKDEEDAMFGKQLVDCVIENRELYRSYINDALDTRVWEADRMAYMDVVILTTAIAEILNFPKIPLTVSINEYVEIAKAYSTRKSPQFIHGVLAAVLKRLKEEGVLLKSLN